MRRALEDREVPDLVHDRRAGLHAAGAGADHRDALALQIVFRLPACGVEDRSLEIVESRNVGYRRPVQLTDGRYDRVRGELDFRTIFIARRDVPDILRFIETGFFDLRVEANVTADVVLVGAACQIEVQAVSFRIEMRPFVARLEGVGIEMVRRVDAAAGIVVLVPGPAAGVVLLDDRERDAGLLQLDRGQDTRHAGTDNHDVEIPQPLGGGFSLAS